MRFRVSDEKSVVQEGAVLQRLPCRKYNVETALDLEKEFKV